MFSGEATWTLNPSDFVEYAIHTCELLSLKGTLKVKKTFLSEEKKQQEHYIRDFGTKWTDQTFFVF
jgi:hypothetical protein